MVQLRDALISLPQVHYDAAMGPLFAGGTIGGHVRHCLDHICALTDGCSSGIIKYDQRERGTLVETQASAALSELDRLLNLVHNIGGSPSGFSRTPVGVRVIPSADGTSIDVSSTVEREMAFVLSHTIHHLSTIRGMLVSCGAGVTSTFGFAPATLAHANGAVCAH